MSKQTAFEKRNQQIEEITKNMDEAIDSYFETPEQMMEYLDFMKNFRQYSPRNSALINTQFHNAVAVGSFKFWKDKGFSVKKGEKGIKILAPNRSGQKFQDETGKWKSMKYASEKQREMISQGKLEKDNGKLYFGVGHVFDVSQTNAKASDLPDIFPNRWMEGEVDNYHTLFQAFDDIASRLHVTIGDPFHELGSAKGAFYSAVDQEGTIGHIALNPRNSELQNVKTMIHELAHAKLHSGKDGLLIPAEEKEFQAEMVAYSTASYFGIDTSDYSLGYLANWTKGKELKDKEKLLSEIKETSGEFIEVIEQHLVAEKELEANLAHEPNEKEYTLLTYGSFGTIEIEQCSVKDIEEKHLEGNEFLSIESFNEEHKEKLTLIDPAELTEPSVVVKWSEASHKLSSNEIIPYVKANEITTELADTDEMGYYKTWYTVIMPNDQGELDVIPMDRLDIGDGEYVNLHHQVRKEAKHRLTDDQWQTLDNVVIDGLLQDEKEAYSHVTESKKFVRDHVERSS